MSWLVKALSIMNPSNDRYYTSVDPFEFYEWRFTQKIPRGTKFAHTLPTTESCISGLLIVAAKIPDSVLEKIDGHLRLRVDTPWDAMTITAGEISSPQEIFHKQAAVREQFSRNLNAFKASMISQKFFISSEEKPKLYKVNSWSDNSVHVKLYAELKELNEIFSKSLSELQKQAAKKHGRSYENEKAMKFENFMAYLRADNQTVDGVKISYLLENSGVSIQNGFDIAWKDLYLRSSQEAQKVSRAIDVFNNLSWVKYTAEYLRSK